MGMFCFHCPSCNEVIETEEEAIGQQAPCPFCGEEILVQPDQEPSSSSVIVSKTPIVTPRPVVTPTPRHSSAATVPPTSTPAGKIQLPGWLPAVLIALLLVNLVLLVLLYPGRRWEYKVKRVSGESTSSFSLEDFKPSPINLTNLTSTLESEAGWELVACVPETETVHPNFGKDEYVTGLQPNVRSNAVLLIFRRAKLF